jgi:hypothetical protein
VHKNLKLDGASLKTLVRSGTLRPIKRLKKTLRIFATLPTCCATNPWRG